MPSAIEAAIKRDDWKAARRLILASLRRTPDSHWLLIRLSLTYYEEFNYARALTLAEKAYKLAPRCPLVLWNLAGTFDMLERYREAIAIYRSLIRRGVEPIAYDECGEGTRWARSLVADCWYRLARCAVKLGRRSEALHNYEKHLEMRGPGCHSIYPIKNVRKEFGKFVAEFQREELDRRLKDYHRRPKEGSPWKVVKSRALRRGQLPSN
jgi:tetratricopeptide (TPR) repeat protein